MTKTAKKKTGRPPAYKEEYVASVKGLALLGATDREIANFYGVSEQTVNTWKKKYPLFLESLRAGKDDADAKVAKSLYDQACEGNTTAQIFWLKNRRSKQWRDKHEVEHSGNIDIAERMIKAQQRIE